MIHLIECSFGEFEKKVNSRKLYCFGAGKFLRHYSSDDCYVKPMAIIDNYSAEKEIVLRGESIPVIRIKDFLPVFDRSCDMLITVSQFEDIVYQLDAINELDGMDCYIYSLLHVDSSFTGNELYPKSPSLISKTIHYCWFGGNSMPVEFEKNIASWSKYCPDYEIKRWDESNYDVSKHPYVYSAYNNRQWAFVSDYARVDIIYHEGGIYFDTDVEVIKNFDCFLGWDLFCGFEDRQYVAWGLGFGAVARHEILLDVLREYDKMDFVMDDGKLNLTTSPMIQSKVMKKHGFQLNGAFQVCDNVAVYPKEFFSPMDYVREITHMTPYAHSIHHYAASWCEKDVHEKRELRERNIRSILARMWRKD